MAPSAKDVARSLDALRPCLESERNSTEPSRFARSPLHPLLLRNDTFPRKGGRERLPLLVSERMLSGEAEPSGARRNRFRGNVYARPVRPPAGNVWETNIPETLPMMNGQVRGTEVSATACSALRVKNPADEAASRGTRADFLWRIDGFSTAGFPRTFIAPRSTRCSSTSVRSGSEPWPPP